MDTQLADSKPLVIFYDCCVPKRQFKKILCSAILFAEHIFARDVFSEDQCDPDKILLDNVEAARLREYPDKICLFVTQDDGFEREVGGHPALDKTIKLLTIDHCSSNETNWLRAGELATGLVRAFAEVIERKNRRGKIIQAEIFTILGKHVRKKIA